MSLGGGSLQRKDTVISFPKFPQHLESCIVQAFESSVRIAEYGEQYPFHCRHCRGWGRLVSSTVHPNVNFSTVEVEPLLTYFYCSHCVTNGNCPRCGSGFDYTEEKSCSFCDFSVGESQGKPLQHICFCEVIKDVIDDDPESNT